PDRLAGRRSLSTLRVPQPRRDGRTGGCAANDRARGSIGGNGGGLRVIITVTTDRARMLRRKVLVMSGVEFLGRLLPALSCAALALLAGLGSTGAAKARELRAADIQAEGFASVQALR